MTLVLHKIKHCCADYHNGGYKEFRTYCGLTQSSNVDPSQLQCVGMEGTTCKTCIKALTAYYNLFH